MKERVGMLYGKPIIIGDENLCTKNEIHINSLKGGGDSSLTKGKKILSEYYYIDYHKMMMEGSEEAMAAMEDIFDFMAVGNSVGHEEYEGRTEVGDIILKTKFGDDYIYINDLLLTGSGGPDGGGPDAYAIAIRKYCKINYHNFGVIKTHVNDYVPVFLGTALFRLRLGSGNISFEEILSFVDEMYQEIISALSPYFISEEEFWNGANIIENAETILNDWLLPQE